MRKAARSFFIYEGGGGRLETNNPKDARFVVSRFVCKSLSFAHATLRGAGIGGARESVGSWSNSHFFIPLKQNVWRRRVAYDTNSGSSSPLVIVACRQPRGCVQPRLRGPRVLRYYFEPLLFER